MRLISPCEILCKCHFGCSNLPNKATNFFIFFFLVTTVLDNWNMHEEDVMWKWPPDLSWELLLGGMAEVVSLCGNLTVPHAQADCTSRSAGWQITQKRCSFEARQRLFLRKVRILESCIHADSGVKSPSEHILWIGETSHKQMWRNKRMLCFTVPGRSGWSAPINMHYNLAQGVIWKGNTTASWCCSFHGNFLVIFFFFHFSSPQT